MSTDIIDSPLRIKNVQLRNRLGVAPMTRMSGNSDSIPRRDVFDFLIRRAEKGAGLVFTEAIVTDYESSQGYPGQARLTTQRQIDSWATVVRKIKENGAAVIMQMFHCGRMAWPEVNPANLVIAPSSVAPRQINPITEQPYPTPQEMTLFDIEHVINGFVETAKGAVLAGFDGIEIHGAHGYLISQFLSSYSNQREDEFGGSLENRFRFARKIISEVRAVIPDDFLLSFRISNWGVADMEVSLFEGAEEWQDLIRLISAEAIDVISVSTYDFQEKMFGTGKTMSQLSREATSLPLMICGRIYDRQTVEKSLEFADIALSGKSTLLNPDWLDKVREGKELFPYSSEEANVAYTEEPLP